jgi:DNA-directed RNA polymerase subunit N (RpoN/RPB10)
MALCAGSFAKWVGLSWQRLSRLRKKHQPKKAVANLGLERICLGLLFFFFGSLWREEALDFEPAIRDFSG